jgi:excisionase family DNA binding protein
MEITFEQLPKAINLLFIKLENIERLLQNANSQQIETDNLLTIQQAAEILRLSVPTIYGLVSRSQIPCMKKGKRLYFSTKELTDWIKTGRKKTVSEVEIEASKFISRKPL